jgi:hypothetical protein
MTAISTLRPGLLVSLKTSCTGNVNYNKEIIEGDHVTDAGMRKATWQTERIIADPEEFERAKRTQSKALTMIRTICTRSSFGLLCPEIDREKLDRAVASARQMAEEFNSSAAITRVHVYVIVGRIAADDVEAVKAINSEISGLMRDMQEGLRNLDVKAVREAANAARNVAQMLSPDAASRVRTAIDLVRASARQIVSAGEEASIEIDRSAIARIEEARTAFIDLDDAREVAAPAVRGRGIDFAPAASAVKTAPKSRAVEY